MKIAPIVLIGIGLTPLLVWLTAFGVVCAICHHQMEKAERDQQRQQARRLLYRNVKVTTVVWAVAGCTTPDNCQMLCRDCNLKKGAQE